MFAYRLIVCLRAARQARCVDTRDVHGWGRRAHLARGTSMPSCCRTCCSRALSSSARLSAAVICSLSALPSCAESTEDVCVRARVGALALAAALKATTPRLLQRAYALLDAVPLAQQLLPLRLLQSRVLPLRMPLARLVHLRGEFCARRQGRLSRG